MGTSVRSLTRPEGASIILSATEILSTGLLRVVHPHAARSRGNILTLSENLHWPAKKRAQEYHKPVHARFQLQMHAKLKSQDAWL